ncbi:MAG: hypothetical protein HUU20_25735, partial [Pirellulales bacterium]|nr:hypothetical protein [Pirellulales bacterium]
KALAVLVELSDYKAHGVYVALMALNAIDYLDEKAASAGEAIRTLPSKVGPELQRMGYGIPPLIEKILTDLEKR